MGTSHPKETNERRRRKCFERMVYEFAERGVGHIVAESRGPRADRRDVAHLDVLRSQQVVPSGLRIDHASGPSEPLLWLPDCVAGAVTAAAHGEPAHLRQMPLIVEVITINYR